MMETVRAALEERDVGEQGGNAGGSAGEAVDLQGEGVWRQ